MGEAKRRKLALLTNGAVSPPPVRMTTLSFLVSEATIQAIRERMDTLNRGLQAAGRSPLTWSQFVASLLTRGMETFDAILAASEAEAALIQTPEQFAKSRKVNPMALIGLR